jgi:L-threonylcarbamoyladenylate synthase
MKPPVLKADSKGIARASRIILQGGIVAFPTETFYGLGADAGDVGALQKVFQIKGREEHKPLLLLLADRTWVPGLVKKIPAVAGCLMENFWPGPLTLIFEASPHLPILLTGGTGKVGLRISSHPVAQALVQKVGRAITGTSANLSGQPSASLAARVSQALGRQIDVILDGGKTTGGLGSTVLDVTGERLKIIRRGVVPRIQLALLLGKKVDFFS